MRLFVLLLNILSSKLAKESSVEAQARAYSNIIWRGITFSENKPAIQASIDAAGPFLMLCRNIYFQGQIPRSLS